MKTKQRSSSFYFLSELLFVIVCFALCSVLCVRLFAMASQKHQLALDQNTALRLIQPLMERLENEAEGPLAECRRFGCELSYDASGQRTERTEDVRFEVKIEKTAAGLTAEFRVTITRKTDQRVLVEAPLVIREEDRS